MRLPHIGYFIDRDFYFTPPTPPLGELHVSVFRMFRPVHSKVRQSYFRHSNHASLMDPRPIISHIVLGPLYAARHNLGTLSADFTELHTIRLSPYMACRSIRGDASRGLSGKAGPIISSTKSKSSPKKFSLQLSLKLL